MNLQGKIKNSILSVPGKKINGKFIVIESDDWGSFRMPSNEAYHELEQLNVPLKFPQVDHFNQYDTLESAEDLQNLYEVLQSVKNRKGANPIFTPLYLSANPDFDTIKRSNFEQYSYLNLEDSYKFYNKDLSFKLLHQGIDNKIFMPQFHGREHLNVPVWLRALQNDLGEVRNAFDKQVWGFINSQPKNISYLAAFDLEYPSDLIFQKEIVKDGLILFEKTFGYKATYFVPPNGPMNNQLLPVLAESGINLITSDTIQLEVFGNGKTKRHFRYMGMKNKFGQRFIKRNCFFEPSSSNQDWVDLCLSNIEIAFKYKKPAVISTHRVNFVGGLSVENRDKGLKQFQQLLKQIVQKWPEVEFIDSSQLYHIFNSN